MGISYDLPAVSAAASTFLVNEVFIITFYFWTKSFKLIMLLMEIAIYTSIISHALLEHIKGRRCFHMHVT